MLEQQDKKANFIAFSSYGEFLFEESIVKPHCPSKKKIMSTEKSLDPGMDANLNSQTYL